MKAKDMVIGDWVYAIDDNGEKHPCRVNNLEYDYINDRDDFCVDFYGTDYNPEWPDITFNVEPIPITPEILEKNGFKIDKNETYCKRYFFACNLSKVPQTVVEFSFFGEGVSADTLFKCWTKPESCDGENNIHICDLKSVHQLQHALRLCGIEKEIEL